MGAVLAVITYVDRVNISVASAVMMKQYNFTMVQMGVMFSAFNVGYFIFMLPGGWLLQRFSFRRMLTTTYTMWGLLTILTGLAGTFSLILGNIFVVLLVVRGLLGLAEAPASPGWALVTSRWAAISERARYIGIWQMGLQLGSALTPVIVTILMLAYGWEFPFYLLGIISIAVAGVFWFIVRDNPREHPRVNEEEAAWIEAGKAKPPANPWGLILRNRNAWFLWMGYGCQGFVASVYIFFMFLYITQVRHVPLASGAILATLPPVMQLIAGPLAGVISDRLVRSHSITFSRRLLAMSGMFATALLTVLGGFTVDAIEAIAVLSLGAGCLWFATTMWWTAATDLGGTYAGGVSSIMNTFAGGIGLVPAPILFPIIGEVYGYGVSLSVVATMAALGGLFWLGIRLDVPIGAAVQDKATG
jgi:ACS family glucarate transporter-like MFS transporter